MPPFNWIRYPETFWLPNKPQYTVRVFFSYANGMTSIIVDYVTNWQLVHSKQLMERIYDGQHLEKVLRKEFGLYVLE